jgi:hypothetical protein
MPVKDKGWFVVVVDNENVEITTRKINSSNVDWIGWPKDSSRRMMIVQYKGGGRYGYMDVSRQNVVAAAHAPSTGKYINERIKPKFRYVKIR